MTDPIPDVYSEMQKGEAEMESRKVVKCGGRENVWVFCGERIFLYAVLLLRQWELGGCLVPQQLY